MENCPPANTADESGNGESANRELHKQVGSPSKPSFEKAHLNDAQCSFAACNKEESFGRVTRSVTRRKREFYFYMDEAIKLRKKQREEAKKRRREIENFFAKYLSD